MAIGAFADEGLDTVSLGDLAGVVDVAGIPDDGIDGVEIQGAQLGHRILNFRAIFQHGPVVIGHPDAANFGAGDVGGFGDDRGSGNRGAWEWCRGWFDRGDRIDVGVRFPAWGDRC